MSSKAKQSMAKPPKASTKSMANQTSVAAKRQTRTGAKAAKDPNAPKKAMSAYILFSVEERERLKGEEREQELVAKEVMVEIGKRWKALDDSAKEKYNRLAAEDKKRYENELRVYQKN